MATSTYTFEDLDNLRQFYKDSLLNDTLKFWLPRSLDTEHGGYLLMRDGDGSLLDDDKSVWFQGRFSSILGKLYNNVEQKEEWLEGARYGVEFLKKYCFDKEDDNKMWFMTTRDGKPLRKRRYYYSEAFTIAAFAEYAKATKDEELAQEARNLFKKCMQYASGEIERGPPKTTGERPAKGLGPPMIFLNVAHTLIETIGCEYAESRIDSFISDIELCVNDELECVMECVTPEGEVINHLQERTITPGHAIEGAWFILHEAKRRGGDDKLQKLGLKMLDYSWKQGWDEGYGGIRYFADPTGKPVMDYWQDMKFWWPQNEAIIATLLAYTLTGDEKYAQWHKMIHEYAHKHFADKEHGEWFGYLHRDGRLSTTQKGNHFKGPFHLPRMQNYCWQLLEAHLKNKSSE